MQQSSESAIISVASVVLASVFLAALLALLLICRNCNFCCLSIPKNKQNKDIQHEALVTASHKLESCLDPEDLLIHPDLDKLLEEHRWKWIDDALGVVPLCLAMLKNCHLMSERLAQQAMASSDPLKFAELAVVAKSILPHVDNLLRCMCPPLDLRLIELSASELLSAITRLAKLTQRTCKVSWPSGIINDMTSHYQQLVDISRRSVDLVVEESDIGRTGNGIIESSLSYM